ncbi:MAG: hypothetical protein K2Q28_14020 [Hyphomicrobium sp.]|nr:hypothetical protein [Hyphomicrobium sp.]
MVDYNVIEGGSERFREKLLALYAERQEAHDFALAAVADGGFTSPSFLMAERRIGELTQEIAVLLGQPPQDWMA